MPLLTCPRGHRWTEAGGGRRACPVCGAPASELPDTTEADVPTPVGGHTRVILSSDTPPDVPGYEVLEEVGRGGMGIVYKARQAALNRVVALKVIRKDRLGSAEAVRRFRREAEAAARLSHANIVLVFDSDQVGDLHYLAMEYVNGITLQQLVDQFGALPVSQAVDYVRQAAMGLQHAHEMALVHRDIKPANLMVVVPQGRPASGRGGPTQPGPLLFHGALVKILDMGVARLYQLGDSPDEVITTLTQAGAMLGTPDFIAPEQLEDAHAADIRADLYSLGCTFHFLLTGQVPFPGGNMIQKLDKHRWATATAADQLRPEVPGAVAAVVRRLMAKKPADRFQTPAELAQALEELTRSGFVAPEAPPPTVRESRRLVGHTDCVWSVATSGDGRLALSGGKDRTLRLWDLSAGTLLRTFPEHPQDVRAAVLTPDGKLAVSASGATIRLFDTATGREVAKLTGHSDAVKTLAVSPDGRRLLSGSDDKTLRLWELPGRREVRRLVGHTRDVTDVVFGSSGQRALSGSRDQTMRLWDLSNGAELRCFPGQRGMILTVALSPDESLALSGNFDTTMRLFETATGKELRQFKGHKQMVSAVSFLPDGRHVLSGSHDHTLRLWDVQSTREVCVCEGHTNWVTSFVVLPGGSQVLSGSADKSLCLWQLPPE